MSEWNQLLTRALVSQTQNLCCANPSLCVSLDTYVGDGLWVMLAAVLLGWLLEVCFSYQFAHLFHPYDRVAAYDCLLEFFAPFHQ